MPDSEFDKLLTFLTANKFNVLIVEGPRGAGKTYFCDWLTSKMELVLYKTWGSNQRNVRHEMSSRLGLDLPAGTYFVLDFVKQIQDSLVCPILADRGNISAVAYQRDQPWGSNRELLQYYASLMKECHAAYLVLTSPVNVIVDRRIARYETDEQGLYKLSRWEAEKIVCEDVDLYRSSVNKMKQAGLKTAAFFQLNTTVCEVLIENSVQVVRPEDKENPFDGTKKTLD